MEILRKLTQLTAKDDVRFLVIGGHALGAHGYNRQTGDLDLLAAKETRPFWDKALEELGYQSFQNHEVFCRYRPPTIDSWPIDLMFVDADTFRKMESAAVQAKFGGVSALAPSAEHMIALKLHALAQGQEHRESKDLLDVVELVKRSKLTDSELSALCKKYDRIDVYDFIKRKRRAKDLDR